ncbi:MAG: outer membrane lipoprotein-sorting protein [Deltaproteobacteria bacterium]|nr:outer membrane lipoprotein-sorting protein [Deltaproteobacteria bacterium]
MRRLTSSLALLSLLLPALALAEDAEAPTAQAIVQAAYDASRLDGAEMISQLTISNAAGQSRVRKIAAVSRTYEGGIEKRLTRFLAPADVKGTGLLSVDYPEKTDDLWLFLPSLRKTRKIVSSERAKSFMGSEFTYSDITPPPLGDFVFTLLGSEEADGVDCWKLEEKPKDEDIADENGFSRRVAWIGKADHVRRKVTYYDLDGELHRELSATGVKLVDEKQGRYRPMQMTMKNLQNGRNSELKIEKIQLREDIPEDYFTTRYLERQ